MTSSAAPAVFVDRDGTLISERDYLDDPDGVELLPGTLGALKRLRAAGYRLVVVTNQSGIARGLYSEAQYHAVARRLDEVLADAGIPVDATYYCPHHPDFTGPCDCRKPGLGLYRRAERDLGVDLSASWYVGDKPTDVAPASALGGRGVLVRTGYGRDHEPGVGTDAVVVDDLAAAAALILGRGGAEAGRAAAR